MACSKLEGMAIYLVNQACGNDIRAGVYIAQTCYYDPQSAGINVQSPQSASTPRRLTLVFVLEKLWIVNIFLISFSKRKFLMFISYLCKVVISIKNDFF